MANDPHLRAKVSMDTADFMSGADRLVRRTGELGKQVGESFKQGLEIAGAFKVFDVVAEKIKEAFMAAPEGIKGAFEAGKQLTELSRQTGMSVQSIDVWKQAMRAAGIDAEELGTTINKMQRSIGNVSGGFGDKSVFSQIGIDANWLKQQKPEDQIEIIGQRISELGSASERTKATMEIFGRGGGQLMRIFSNPEAFKEATKELGSQTGILDKNAVLFTRITNLIELIPIKIRGLWVGMAEPISRVLLPALEKIEKVDLSGIGQKFGNYIATAVRVLYNAFQDGQLWNIFGLGLKVAIGRGINYLVGGAYTFGDILGSVLKNTLGNEAFYEGFIQLWVGIGSKITAILMRAFDGPLQSAENFKEELIFKNTPQGQYGAMPGTSGYETARRSLFSDYAALREEHSNKPTEAAMYSPEEAEKEFVKRRVRALQQIDEIRGRSGDVTLSGQTANQFDDQADALIKSAKQNLVPVFSNIAASIRQAGDSFKPGDAVRGQSANEDRFRRLINSENRTIPGEEEAAKLVGKSPIPDSMMGADYSGEWNSPRRGTSGAIGRSNAARHMAVRNYGGSASTAGRGRVNGGSAGLGLGALDEFFRFGRTPSSALGVHGNNLFSPGALEGNLAAPSKTGGLLLGGLSGMARGAGLDFELSGASGRRAVQRSSRDANDPVSAILKQTEKMNAKLDSLALG